MLKYSNKILAECRIAEETLKWKYPLMKGTVSRPPGFFFDVEGILYENFVSKIKNGKIAEIGSLFGRSISFIYDTCKRNKNTIYSIDNHYRQLFSLYLLSWKDKGIVKIITETSIAASQRFPDGFFDLVFIDANHSYEFVKNDIIAWKPKIKQGGILMGHDYNYEGEGVIRAVNELLPEAITPHAKLNSIWYIEC